MGQPPTEEEISMLNQIAFVCDRPQGPLSVAIASAHQRGHYRLSNAVEVAIAALEVAAARLVGVGSASLRSLGTYPGKYRAPSSHSGGAAFVIQRRIQPVG
jgi:hypothetical protein